MAWTLVVSLATEITPILDLCLPSSTEAQTLVREPGSFSPQPEESGLLPGTRQGLIAEHQNPELKKKKYLQCSSLGRIASSPNLIISLKCSCQHRDPASVNLQACLLRCHLRTIDNCGNWHQFLQGLVKLIIPETCHYFLKCFILPIVSLHFLKLQHSKEESYKRKLQDLQWKLIVILVQVA